jgi:hypothetical protein
MRCGWKSVLAMILATCAPIARKLFEKALDGDLQAIREIADGLDGKPAQAIERGNVSVEVLSDHELFAIIRGEPFAPIDGANRPLIGPPHAAK